MSLQKPALLFKANQAYQFNNNKEFLLTTNGQGIKCELCQSKIFFAYANWRAHTKSKKHQKLIQANKINNEKDDIDANKLKEELKIQKALVCQYANQCENYKLKLLTISRELKKIKLEIKKKFKLSVS